MEQKQKLSMDDYLDYTLKKDADKYGITVKEYMQYASECMSKCKDYKKISQKDIDYYISLRVYGHK